jgi:catechol 2,3-dioxygenase-like lactoylglutathione lyase family enzyme
MMKTGQLEHVNLTVSDPQRAADLMIDLFGWHIRWQGPSMLGGETIHVGNDDDYFALYTNETARGTDAGFKKSRPLNHVGVVVEDLDGVEAKVAAAGLKPYAHDDYEPGRRFYFFDWDGIEYEVISYA